MAEKEIHGEWMGFLKVGADNVATVKQIVGDLLAKPENRKAKLLRLLNELIQRGHKVRVLYTTGHWLDIDSLDDVVNAGSF